MPHLADWQFSAAIEARRESGAQANPVITGSGLYEQLIDEPTRQYLPVCFGVQCYSACKAKIPAASLGDSHPS
jgi:hypothetical protein